jgi:DNA-binding response OmpR family regulator
VYDYNAIDALVYRLRQRIEQDPGNPHFLVTVRGFGYKLTTQAE